jgi:PmbA protein
MEDAILKAARQRAAAAEVYSERGTATFVRFVANRCEVVESREFQGAGLRVVHDGRVGFASATALDQPEELADAALEAADFGPTASFEFPPAVPLPRTRLFNDRVALEPAEMVVALGDRVVEQCRQAVPSVEIGLTLSKNVTLRRVLNSRGFDAAYERASFSLAMEGLLTVQARPLWLYDFVNMSENCRCDVNALAQRLHERAKWCQRLVGLRAGTYPCIFAEFAAWDVLQPLLPAVNGRNLMSRDSPLVGREEERVFDPKLTVLDDGLRDFAFESAPFDSEGVPRRRTAVIENGVFRSFLCDLQTAAATGRESTGSACRDRPELPRPGWSNLVVTPGRMELKRALAGIREGLLIYSLLGAGGPSSLHGDFACSVALGFKVENGEVAGCVKDAVVSGNIFELGRAVAGIGDTAFDLGDAAIPFLFFPAVTVTVKS